jgi:hypothetical protein
LAKLHFDGTSKLVVSRFGVKLALVLFLIGFTGQRLYSVLLGASLVLCIHAARSALVLKERLLRPVFGYWDEAIWFLTIATATNAVGDVSRLVP